MNAQLPINKYEYILKFTTNVINHLIIALVFDMGVFAIMFMYDSGG